MKTKLFSLAAATVLLGTAAAAPAAKTGQAEDKAASAAANTGEKKICKRLASSGTRLEPRACLTKAEWKKLEDLQ